VQVMIKDHAISVRQACRAARLARSAYYAPRRPRDDSEVLNCYVFETLGEVRRMTAEWINRYNELRPHEALGDVPPRRYLMAQSR
jgi:transposase InsO family protein